jgi:hypothetical protein
MSRVTAAREKRSAWVGFVWVECHVWREGLDGFDDCCWGVMMFGEVDGEGRVGGGETREVVDAAEEDVVEELDDVIDGVERRALGLLQIALRWCLSVGLRVLSVFPEVDVAEEDEDDEEKAKEKRDGEPGRPMRITVPFEAAESGRGRSGDAERLSSRVDRVRRDGFLRRPVRPPDGRRVLLGIEG